MSMQPRTGGTLAVLLLAGLAAMAVSAPAAAASTADSAREALDAQARAMGVETAALDDAAWDCALIASVRLERDAYDARVLLDVLGAAPAAVKMDASGRTLRIDFEGAVLRQDIAASQSESTGLIRGIHAQQLQLIPAPSARVEIALATPCNIAIEEDGDGMTMVHIAPKDRSLGALYNGGPNGTQRTHAVRIRSIDEKHAVQRAEDPFQAIAAQLETVRADGQGAAAFESASLKRRAAARQAELAQMLEDQRRTARLERVAGDLQAVRAPETNLRLDDSTHAAPGRLLLAQNNNGADLQINDAEPAELPDDVQEMFTEPAPAEEAVALPPPPAPRDPAAPAYPHSGRATEQLVTQIRELERDEPPAPDVVPAALPRPQAEVGRPAVTGDPLSQIVNIDFREMDLANVVAILAHRAGINVIAGTELTGTVTANLRNVTLRRAMETVLRINDLGLVEEEGIYRIVPYPEAIALQRVTVMVDLKQGKVQEVRRVIEEIIVGSPDQRLISISSNPTSNVLIISGPSRRVEELVELAKGLDVAEPVLPTVTEAIKLNYSEPTQLQALVASMLTPEIGQVGVDQRARHIVVTDVPVVVEQVRDLVKSLDLPVRQVSIEAMVVDAVLQDEAQTGVDWVFNSIRRQSRRGQNIGVLDELLFDTNLPGAPTSAGSLAFGIISSRIDLRGMIQAEVRNDNGNLLSNPVLVTVENKPAKIVIAEEVPFIELTQTAQGGQQTSTEFKEIGTILEVTPRVTHDDHILVEIIGKESATSGEFQGIPIEQKREIESTLRVKNNQTIFIGGLRKDSEGATIRKVPVLGDIPVVNFMFRNNIRNERINELLIFLTCHILPDDIPHLTPYQQAQHDRLDYESIKPDAQGDLFRDTLRPHEMRDPIWKWRRTE